MLDTFEQGARATTIGRASDADIKRRMAETEIDRRLLRPRQGALKMGRDPIGRRNKLTEVPQQGGYIAVFRGK